MNKKNKKNYNYIIVTINKGVAYYKHIILFKR